MPSPDKKCVRAVDEKKLLTSNPFHEFDWIEGEHKPRRQFSAEELLSLMEFLETDWKQVTAGALACKVLLWSWLRREEVTSLMWSDYRHFHGEHHFEVVGKQGVRKWFRVPDSLYQDLAAIRTDSPFVFSAYPKQLLICHANKPTWLQHVDEEYAPERLGEWLYDRIKDWAQRQGNPAYVHTFRKTAMQFARRGEDVNPQVAAALRVSPRVMLGHYVNEDDALLHRYSNDTFNRIAAALPVEVACRYGYKEAEHSSLQRQLHVAIASENWDLAKELAARLAGNGRSEAG